MAGQLIECVPNFSEGRDRRVVEAIVGAIAGAPGVALLAHESDIDHNRSVVTFAGEPSCVVEGALRGIKQAVRNIDLRKHEGVHPRIGAADVVPFVPVRGITLEQTAGIAHDAGQEIWRRLGVPVYFYEAAALRSEYRRLELVRRGGFHALRNGVANRQPDVGGPELHPSAGACIVGARNFLIAFNVDLRSDDLEAARSIARRVRASTGGLPTVKAIGVPLPSRGIVQVSMNLTDFGTVGIYAAFQAVEREARARGIEVEATELIGLIPRKALEGGDPASLRFQDFGPHRVLEDRIAQTAS
jgi:glutamate formiminotransferase